MRISRTTPIALWTFSPVHDFVDVDVLLLLPLPLLLPLTEETQFTNSQFAVVCRCGGVEMREITIPFLINGFLFATPCSPFQVLILGIKFAAQNHNRRIFLILFFSTRFRMNFGFCAQNVINSVFYRSLNGACENYSACSSNCMSCVSQPN